MYISLYRSVFSNVYLSNKIFATVHQIQRYHNSLGYDDIVDIGWMYSHKHIGLLKEKINRNIQLHVRDQSILAEIANTHPDLFIQLIESDRYSSLMYPSCTKLKNVEVLKCVIDKGYGTETNIMDFEQLYDMDKHVLEYQLEKSWCRPTFRSLLLFNYNNLGRYYYDPTKAQETKEKIQLIIKYLESPISLEDSQKIINHLFQYPTPLVIDSIEPLLHMSVTFGPERRLVDEIKRKEIETFSVNKYVRGIDWKIELECQICHLEKYFS
ncbi:hypothetical protein CYY_010274 [Polysphondylium violaceum]|uniref:Ankyrin repeat protein n=1 Tax=Polysphondylium violaceum TaxID=133409 RepID=A0A8J4UV85_9MYCE|nr:hypothetical protein CYY_010274 [Polysphondylium violaceum]